MVHLGKFLFGLIFVCNLIQVFMYVRNSSDVRDELKTLRKSIKRKSVDSDPSQADQSTEADSSRSIDKAFVEYDRLVLAKLRADETPAQTRSTVLRAPNAVRC